MRNNKGLVVAICLALAPCAPTARAQEAPHLSITPPGKMVRLQLVDGSTLVGRIVRVDSVSIRFASSIGENDVRLAAIKTARTADESAIHNGEFWPADPGLTRILFAPTGRMLATGEGYVADAYVLFPSVQYGVTDKLTIGGGATLIPGLSPDEQIFYITPKVGLYASPEVNIAAGALVAGGSLIDEVTPAGIVYSVGTFGREDANVTVGAGFGFSRSTTSAALLLLGGSTRVSKNIAFVTENYLYTGGSSSSIITGGIRFIGESLSVDFAVGTQPGSAVAIPYIAFIYRW